MFIVNKNPSNIFVRILFHLLRSVSEMLPVKCKRAEWNFCQDLRNKHKRLIENICYKYDLSNFGQVTLCWVFLENIKEHFHFQKSGSL